jgi:hypothetical protein
VWVVGMGGVLVEAGWAVVRVGEATVEGLEVEAMEATLASSDVEAMVPALSSTAVAAEEVDSAVSSQPVPLFARVGCQLRVYCCCAMELKKQHLLFRDAAMVLQLLALPVFR